MLSKFMNARFKQVRHCVLQNNCFLTWNTSIYMLKCVLGYIHSIRYIGWYSSKFECIARSCFFATTFLAITRPLKLKLDTCNLHTKCILNIKNNKIEGFWSALFFLAPIKWPTSGLVRSAQNLFRSKRYVIKITRKKL